MIAVNKADGAARARTRSRRPGSCPARCGCCAAPDDAWQAAGADLQRPASDRAWTTVWERLEQHRDAAGLDRASWPSAAGDQQVDWTWAMVRDRLLARLRDDPGVRALAPALEQQVRDGSRHRDDGRGADPRCVRTRSVRYSLAADPARLASKPWHTCA